LTEAPEEAEVAVAEDPSMQVTVHTAKSQLSKLIDAALAGEEVVIAKGSKPVVRLVPITRCRYRFGGLEALAGTEPDFFEATSTEDLDLWEGR
jgi:prevent-host-death family protein